MEVGYVYVFAVHYVDNHVWRNGNFEVFPL